MSASTAGKTEYIQNLRESRLRGIGGFVPSSRLEKIDAGWRITTAKCDQVSKMIEDVVQLCVLTGELTADQAKAKISGTFAFKDQYRPAIGTGFLVHSDMIVATAGHVVFETPPEAMTSETLKKLTETPISQLKPKAEPEPFKPADLENYKFVFGLLERHVQGDAIPAQDVWDIDRILFGQTNSFKDVKTDTVFSSSSNDLLDWALVRLKKTPASPAADPGNILQLYNGPPLTPGSANIMEIGHTWGTSLKISNHPTQQAELRTTVKVGARDYPLSYSYRHNLRVAPGNSGCPMIWRAPAGTMFFVVASESSGSGKFLKQHLLTLNADETEVVPYFPDASDVTSQYGAATKVDVWASLITPRATLTIVARVIDETSNKNKDIKGKLSIRLEFNDKIAPPKDPLTLPPVNGSFDSIRFDYALPDGYISCDLTAVNVTYELPAGAYGSVIVGIERLQVFSRKPGDENYLNWTPLLFYGSYVPTQMRSTDSNSKAMSLTLPTQRYIPKEWNKYLVTGEGVPAKVDWKNF